MVSFTLDLKKKKAIYQQEKISTKNCKTQKFYTFLQAQF